MSYQDNAVWSYITQNNFRQEFSLINADRFETISIDQKRLLIEIHSSIIDTVIHFDNSVENVR